MSVSLYELCVPVMRRNLVQVKHLLDVGQQHCEALGVDPDQLLQARLVFDMHPLLRQVQSISDNAKGCAARLADVPVPPMADDEKTLADAQARLAKTIDFIDGLRPDQFEGAEARPVVLRFPTRTIEFASGLDYLQRFALSNFMFHVGAAYMILRSQGVKVGKLDFLGEIG